MAFNGTGPSGSPKAGQAVQPASPTWIGMGGGMGGQAVQPATPNATVLQQAGDPTNATGGIASGYTGASQPVATMGGQAPQRTDMPGTPAGVQPLNETASSTAPVNYSQVGTAPGFVPSNSAADQATQQLLANPNNVDAMIAQMQNDPRGAAAQQHYADIAARDALLQQRNGGSGPGMPAPSMAQTDPLRYIALSQAAGNAQPAYFNPQPFISAATQSADALQAYNDSAAGKANNALPVDPRGYSSFGGQLAPQQSAGQFSYGSSPAYGVPNLWNLMPGYSGGNPFGSLARLGWQNPMLSNLANLLFFP